MNTTLKINTEYKDQFETELQSRLNFKSSTTIFEVLDFLKLHLIKMGMSKEIINLHIISFPLDSDPDFYNMYDNSEEISEIRLEKLNILFNFLQNELNSDSEIFEIDEKPIKENKINKELIKEKINSESDISSFKNSLNSNSEFLKQVFKIFLEDTLS